MSRPLDQRRYRAAMLDALDQMDERAEESAATNQQSVDLMVELATRYRHARAAFPGITWDEFIALAQSREHAGKRGRRVQSREERASTPIARAARDADRLAALWAASGEAGEPPLSQLEIAADRHGVSEEELGERVRRPKSRNPHRMIEDR
ncbi:hypothetical protein [Sphingomonas sp.]|jgi:hypothetical protein|uniref:hypothetical protein n=1 Tax=Sphingomonas sp. TaxID=28214 RepID=UPI00262C13E5|nr:hypothetical protein [Sphingomonas sp.]MDF2493698.1 hypothetical protein [Sphingomonas sp.]